MPNLKFKSLTDFNTYIHIAYIGMYLTAVLTRLMKQYETPVNFVKKNIAGEHTNAVIDYHCF